MINGDLIAGFAPISLTELECLSLQNRTDTKYVFHKSRLPDLLNLIRDKYKLLEIENRRLMNYHTSYYDTPDLRLYLDHHNGKSNRFKVRFRDYTDSRVSFFEIKKKINGNRTRKVRIEAPWEQRDLSEKPIEFIAKHTSLKDQELILTMDNNFHRITLASYVTCERITLDFDIVYSFGGRSKSYDGIIVAEIKRGQGCSHSPMAEAMKQLHIRPESFSKYCIGIVSLYDNVKYNRFKPRLLTINKLQNGGN
jgi:hypothetical protein